MERKRRIVILEREDKRLDSEKGSGKRAYRVGRSEREEPEHRRPSRELSGYVIMSGMSRMVMSHGV